MGGLNGTMLDEGPRELAAATAATVYSVAESRNMKPSGSVPRCA